MPYCHLSRAKFAAALKKSGLSVYALARNAGTDAQPLRDVLDGKYGESVRLQEDRCRRLATALRLGSHEELHGKVKVLGSIALIEDRPWSYIPEILPVFFGREKEKSDLEQALASPGCVEVYGLAGIGKTRLVLAVSAERDYSYESVWIVPLVALGRTDVRERLLARLLVGVSASLLPLRDTFETLVDSLSTHPTLLILDHCDDAAPVMPEFARILCSRCPELRLILTCRNPIAIPDSRPIHLGPLETAGLEDMADNVAATKPAIKLALAGLNRRQRSRLNVKHRPRSTKGRKSAQPRRQSFRNACDLAARSGGNAMKLELDLSSLKRYQNLCSLLQRLASFRNGFTFAGALCVYPRKQVRTTKALRDMVSDLVRRGLIHRVSAKRGPVRFRMLESVREFAENNLLTVRRQGRGHTPRTRGERPPQERTSEREHLTSARSELAGRMRKYFLSLALGSHGEGELAGQPRLPELIESERANLAWAICVGIDDGTTWEHKGLQTTYSVVLAAYLSLHWSARGHPIEGAALACWALEDERVRAAGRAPTQHQDWRTPIRGSLLDYLATTLSRLGMHDIARKCWMDAILIARQHARPQLAIRAFNNLSLAAEGRAEFPEAVLHLRAALTMAKRIGDTLGEARAHAGLVGLLTELARLKDAQLHVELAHRLCLKLEADKKSTDFVPAVLRLAAAEHALREDRNWVASVLFETALAERRKLKNPDGQVSALIGLGRVSLRMNDSGAAAVRLKEAYTRSCISPAIPTILRVQAACLLGSASSRQGNDLLAARLLGVGLGLAARHSLQNYLATHFDIEEARAAVSGRLGHDLFADQFEEWSSVGRGNVLPPLDVLEDNTPQSETEAHSQRGLVPHPTHEQLR